MAILIATKGFLIPAATSVAWEALYDLKYWKNWNRRIHEIELLESPKGGALGRIAFKPNVNRILRINEVEPGRRMQWEFETALGYWVHQCGIIDNAEGAIVTFETRFRGRWEPLVCKLLEKRASLQLEEQGMRFASVCREIATSKEVQAHISKELAKAV